MRTDGQRIIGLDCYWEKFPPKFLGCVFYFKFKKITELSFSEMSLNLFTFYPFKDCIISTNQNNWIPPTCVILENIFCQKCSQNGDLDVSNDFLKGGEKQGKEGLMNFNFFVGQFNFLWVFWG